MYATYLLHKVKRSMMVLRPLLCCACTAHSCNLLNFSSISFFHVFFGLPDGRRPGTSPKRTFPRASRSSLLATSSYIATPHLLATSSLHTRSRLVTPVIHLSILRSHPTNTLSSLFVKAHVSPPYNITDLPNKLIINYNVLTDVGNQIKLAQCR